MILLWQDNNTWCTTIPTLKLNSLCNSILFHSVHSKTGTLSKAITHLFPIQAYFAPKWNKTRLMISITLTLHAVYSAWSLGEGAALHKSWWWRTFTRGMIQWGGWQFVLAHHWGNKLLFVLELFLLLHSWFMLLMLFGLGWETRCNGRYLFK